MIKDHAHLSVEPTSPDFSQTSSRKVASVWLASPASGNGQAFRPESHCKYSEDRNVPSDAASRHLRTCSRMFVRNAGEFQWFPSPSASPAEFDLKNPFQPDAKLQS
jgi:hypothetical protein